MANVRTVSGDCLVQPCLLQQGHPQPIAQHHIQTFLDISRDRESTPSLGKPVPVLTLTVNEYFLRGIACISVCAASFFLYTTEQSLAQCSLQPHFGYLYTLIRSPLGLLQGEIGPALSETPLTCQYSYPLIFFMVLLNQCVPVLFVVIHSSYGNSLCCRNYVSDFGDMQ